MLLDVSAINILRVIVEVVLLWIIYYMIFIFIRGSRAVQLLKGLLLIITLLILTQQFGLSTVNWIITKILPLSVLALLIIFQPELRRGLAMLGQFGAALREEEVLDEIVKAVTVLSKKKIGALIAIEKEVGLRPYIESGIPLYSKVTSELINTIFMPNTPLHDGGIIVEADTIASAGCLFPLSQDPRLSKTMGMRHRAAIGLSEETDAIVIAVSEETGAISLAVAGRLTRDMDKENLLKSLENSFGRDKRGRRLLKFLRKRHAEN